MAPTSMAARTRWNRWREPHAAALIALVAACGRSGFEPRPDSTASTRVTEDLVALYRFGEGAGTIALDTSGSQPPLDLELGADTSWIAGGIRFGAAATATRSMRPAASIVSRCQAAAEITLEAWLKPEQLVSIGASRIIGIAGNNNVSNASIGQEASSLYGQTRTTMSSTKLASAPETTRIELIHVVHTHAAGGARTLYLDGVETATTASPGDFSNWDGSLPLTLGDSLDGGVRWVGRFYLAALYCRALPQDEVRQNFEATSQDM